METVNVEAKLSSVVVVGTFEGVVLRETGGVPGRGMLVVVASGGVLTYVRVTVVDVACAGVLTIERVTVVVVVGIGVFSSEQFA